MKNSKEEEPKAGAKLLPNSTGSPTLELTDYEENSRDVKIDKSPATVAEMKHRLVKLIHLALGM